MSGKRKYGCKNLETRQQTGTAFFTSDKKNHVNLRESTDYIKTKTLTLAYDSPEPFIPDSPFK